MLISEAVVEELQKKVKGVQAAGCCSECVVWAIVEGA